MFPFPDSVNYSDGEGTTPIHVCAESGNIECLRILLRKKVDINKKDACFLTPIHLAASGGHTECLQLLIDHGAHLNEVDIWGWTPLHRSVINHQFAAAITLLKAGCNTNVADENKRIALHVAASYGHRVLLKKLVYAGSSLNWQDARGRTPLYLAVVGKHARVVEDLIQYGCDMNLATTSNVTPLTLAAQKGHEDCVRVLLETGARCTNSRSSRGAVPLESALLRALNRDGKKFKHYVSIVFLLLQAGGEAPCPQSFYVALGAIKNDICQEWLHIVHLLIIAGTKPQLPKRDYPTKADEIIKDWVDKYMHNALSLKDLCRQAIRRHLQHCHGNIIVAAKKLPVPKPLKDIILLKDVYT